MVEQILDKLDRKAISSYEAIEQLTHHFLGQGYGAASARYKAEMTVIQG